MSLSQSSISWKRRRRGVHERNNTGNLITCTMDKHAVTSANKPLHQTSKLFPYFPTDILFARIRIVRYRFLTSTVRGHTTLYSSISSVQNFGIMPLTRLSPNHLA